ncbi:hypothetical protein TCON_0046 [Astathelohania contejeani]|uniref:Uncharacterized protein n=1 Tax=Astathelohania contejeani TaxID=164912 RepID=A0ABQ7I2X3_9MICR|nr:hypothetical protein TCON_0046 [Thelohania contejeani]
MGESVINRNGLAVISFDEGPSKNFDKLIELSNDIPIVLYVDPFKIIDPELISRISKDYEVGLAITTYLNENEDSEKVIQKYIDKFILVTGFKPRLARLARCGYDEYSEKMAESKGLIVTRPNLDSQDIEMPNFMDHLEPTIKESDPCTTSLQITFRDRFSESVKALPRVVAILRDNGFQLSCYSNALGVCTELKPEKDTTSSYDSLDASLEVDNKKLNKIEDEIVKNDTKKLKDGNLKDEIIRDNTPKNTISDNISNESSIRDTIPVEIKASNKQTTNHEKPFEIFKILLLFPFILLIN